MDPQAALKRYWSAVDDGDTEEANEAYNNLRHWLERGGFEPDWDKSGHTRAEFFASPHRKGRVRDKPIPYDDGDDAAPDERDTRWVTLYDDEALEIMQGWTGGQSDPLYAISSSGGGNYAWVFTDAISNLSRDISGVKKLGRNKYQLGKGTFSKKEIDELSYLHDALRMALDGSDGPHEAREAPRGRQRGGSDRENTPNTFEVISGDGRVIAHISASLIEQAEMDLARGKRGGWYPDDATLRGSGWGAIGGSRVTREARGGAADQQAAHELVLYIQNTSELSPDGPHGQGRSVLLNAMRRWKKGTYDPELAVRLFEHLAEAGAKQYAKEFGSGSWSAMFNVPTRREAARELEEYFRAEAELGNYDHIDVRPGARESPGGHMVLAQHRGRQGSGRR